MPRPFASSNRGSRSTDQDTGRQHQADGQRVSIILQSTVGGFSAQFMRQMPQVERAMRERGLEPSQFVISKDNASTATVL